MCVSTGNHGFGTRKRVSETDRRLLVVVRRELIDSWTVGSNGQSLNGEQSEWA